MFLVSKDIHYMYQLTKEELTKVAEEFGVQLAAEKREERQIELRVALRERGWFNENHSRSEKDGESDEQGERRTDFEGFLPNSLIGLMEGLSNSEKMEMLKYQMQMQVQMDRVRAD